MHSFAALHAIIQSYDDCQLSAHSGAYLPLPLSSMSGHVQCAALDTGTQKLTGSVRTVVAIGTNYTQSKSRATFPTRFLNGSVLDEAAAMRRAVDFVIAAFDRNQAAWRAAGECAGRNSLQPKEPYHLVAMNLSPFITVAPWGDAPALHSVLLCAWPPMPHLDSFSRILGAVDLWIAHGEWASEPVKAWLRGRGLAPWISTYNLSGIGLASMKKAQANHSHSRHAQYR
jgi:hypothetical protein